MSAIDYELVYFPIAGRAESIRLLFAIAGVEFKDTRIPFEQWAEHKANAPLGQMPFLIETTSEGSTRYPQSQSILRRLARRWGLYGTTEAEQTDVDIAADTTTDLRDRYVQLVFGPNNNDEGRAKFFHETFPVHAARLTKVLHKHGGPFVLGPSLCFADAMIFDLVNRLTELQSDCMADQPALRAAHAAFGAHPSIQAYVAGR
jgi:glutathione S-transferase